LEKKSILIVEDEVITGMELREQLESWGYVVPVVAHSREEAMEAIWREVPDAILLDIRLGESMTGIDLARQVRAVSNVPILFLTAHSDDETIRKAAATGPVAFLTKPVSDRILDANLRLAFMSPVTSKEGLTPIPPIEALHVAAITVDSEWNLKACNHHALALVPGIAAAKNLKDILSSGLVLEATTQDFLPAIMENGLELFVHTEDLPVEYLGSRIVFFEKMAPKDRVLIESMASDLNAEIMKLLPENGRLHSRLSIYGELLPSTSGSGDLYDVIPVSEGLVVFYLMDIMGHGLIPALSACTIHEIIRSLSRDEKAQARAGNRDFDIVNILKVLNNRLVSEWQPGRFMALTMGLLDLDRGTLVLVQSGQPYTLLCSANGILSFSDKQGLALGVQQNPWFLPVKTTFRPGDRLVVASDGYLAAFVDDEARRGVHGLLALEEVIRPWLNASLDDFTAGIRSARKPHKQADETRDDATILILESPGANA